MNSACLFTLETCLVCQQVDLFLVGSFGRSAAVWEEGGVWMDTIPPPHKARSCIVPLSSAKIACKSERAGDPLNVEVFQFETAKV